MSYMYNKNNTNVLVYDIETNSYGNIKTTKFEKRYQEYYLCFGDNFNQPLTVREKCKIKLSSKNRVTIKFINEEEFTVSLDYLKQGYGCKILLRGENGTSKNISEYIKQHYQPRIATTLTTDDLKCLIINQLESTEIDAYYMQELYSCLQNAINQTRINKRK